MSETAEKPANEKPKKKGTFAGLMLGILMAVMAVVFLPMTLVVVVCLVPSAVAFFVDTSRDRLLGPTVLLLNAAGVVPALFSLWQHGHSMGAAVGIVTQPTILLIALLPSGLAWMLFNYTPFFVSSILRRKAEMRIRAIEKYQEAMVKEWGPEVMGQQNQSQETNFKRTTLST